MKTKPTANDGAKATRQQIKRHIALMRRQRKFSEAKLALDYLTQWIVDMPWRASRKAGGLGRK